MGIEYHCYICDHTEAQCQCERYCFLCQGVSNIRLCEDGQYYCLDCREACDFRAQDA